MTAEKQAKQDPTPIYTATVKDHHPELFSGPRPLPAPGSSASTMVPLPVPHVSKLTMSEEERRELS